MIRRPCETHGETLNPKTLNYKTLNCGGTCLHDDGARLALAELAVLLEVAVKVSPGAEVQHSAEGVGVDLKP